MTYKELLGREGIISVIGGLALLGLSVIADHYADAYALVYSVRSTSAGVGDLFLDNLPVVNLNFLIVEGALLSIVVSIGLVLMRPQYILFSLKTVALLIMVRAFFISLTHVGIYPGQIDPGPGPLDAIYSFLNFQTGFFFSGHTSMPFLMALIFWDNIRLRIAYFGLSALFGISVLLAHIHYSIDVFAAPFIAYGIFRLAQRLFPQDYQLTQRS